MESLHPRATHLPGLEKRHDTYHVRRDGAIGASESRKSSATTVNARSGWEGSDTAMLACTQRHPLARGLRKARRRIQCDATCSFSAWSCRTGREVKVILEMVRASGLGTDAFTERLGSPWLNEPSSETSWVWNLGEGREGKGKRSCS